MSLFQYAHLIDIMARMNLRADATRFFLGYIWWVLEPLLWVGVFYFVFVTIMASREADFLMFLATGKLVFVWFSKSVTTASNSILGGKGLLGKIDLPKTLFPMAVVQEGIYKQAAVFVTLGIILLINGYAVTATWWYLVPLLIVNYVVIVACAFVGACLVCLARDFLQLISLGMIFLMFTSGIFWDVRALDPEKAKLVLDYNPMAFLIDAYRQIMMHATAPDMLHLSILGAAFGTLLCAMVLLMRHRSQYLALRALTA